MSSMRSQISEFDQESTEAEILPSKLVLHKFDLLDFKESEAKDKSSK